MLAGTKKVRAGNVKSTTMDLPTIVTLLWLNPEKLPQRLAIDGPVRFKRQTYFTSGLRFSVSWPAFAARTIT